MRNNNKSVDFKQEKDYTKISKMYPRLSRKEDETVKHPPIKKQNSLLRRPTEIKNRKIVNPSTER